MTSLPGSNPMDRRGVIFAGVVISALGALTYNLLPLFLGSAQDYRGLSDQAVGILSSSFYVGFTLATVTAFFWIRRFNWRIVTFVAIPIAAIAMLTVGQTAEYGVMLGAMACAGGAFSVLYGIGTTVLSDTGTGTVTDNDTATFTIDDQTVDEADGTLTFTVSSVENGQFQLVSNGSPVTSFTQQQVAGGEIQFVHNDSEVSPSYSVLVSDGTNDSGAPAGAAMTYTPVNDTPVASEDRKSVV